MRNRNQNGRRSDSIDVEGYNQLAVEYRDFLNRHDVPAIAKDARNPTHVQCRGDTPPAPLTGSETIALARRYRKADPKDSPSIFAFSHGKRFRNIASLLDDPVRWAINPSHGCHKSFSSVGGLTIRLTDVHKMSPRVDAFRRGVFDATNSTGEVHAFYTTPNSGVAVPFHRDSGTQVIYQILGSKKWFFDESSKQGVSVAPGDLLVIPVGRVHRTETHSMYSVHLTFMLNPISALAVMDLLVGTVTNRGF